MKFKFQVDIFIFLWRSSGADGGKQTALDQDLIHYILSRLVFSTCPPVRLRELSAFLVLCCNE